jgi:putative NADH-flavin reductase
MNIALFGASGAIGTLLTKEILEHGDIVYAYARNSEKIKMKNDNLHIIKGELTDEAAMESVIESADIVISTLGPMMNTKRREKATPIADGHALMIKVMKKYNKKRLITLATPSLKADDDPNKFALKMPGMLAEAFLPPAYRDIVKLGTIIKSSGLDWTVIRMINPNAKTSGNGYKMALGNEKIKQSVSRENVAESFYEVAVQNKYIHKMPIVFNI